VNLTDGLDGLAIMPRSWWAMALGVFAYATGNIRFAGYLQIPSSMAWAKLLIFSSTLTGAGPRFLWVNAYRPKCSWATSGRWRSAPALGTIAVIVRQEIVLFIMGAYSSSDRVGDDAGGVVQAHPANASFAWRPCITISKLKGWPEPKVIVRF